jgi:hypothetical protein
MVRPKHIPEIHAAMNHQRALRLDLLLMKACGPSLIDPPSLASGTR